MWARRIPRPSFGVERARELLEDPGQGELELGQEPAAPRPALIGEPEVPALFLEPGCQVRERGPVAPPTVLGPPRGFSTTYWLRCTRAWVSTPWVMWCSETW